MKTNEPNFSQVLHNVIQELTTLEKACKKVFLKIRKLAESPELAKALHDDQTGITDHIGRLKLIKIEIGKTATKLNTANEINLSLNHDKKKGVERDLWLVAKAQQFILQKIALYKLTHHIALQLELPHSPVLLEQSTKENEATSTWLDRIAHRILNDEIIIPVEQL